MKLRNIFVVLLKMVKSRKPKIVMSPIERKFMKKLIRKFLMVSFIHGQTKPSF